jgi:hypothetical protein
MSVPLIPRPVRPSRHRAKLRLNECDLVRLFNLPEGFGLVAGTPPRRRPGR